MTRARPAGRLRLLVVEDNPGDARLARELLDEEEEGAWSIEEAGRLADALESASSGAHDAVLLDLGLPDSWGLATVRRLCGAAPELAVVVLTGLDDRAVGVEAVHAGAQDFLVKGSIDGPLLARTLRHAVERKAAQEELARLAAIVESSDDAIVGADAEGRILTWNEGARRLFGLSGAEALGKPLSAFGDHIRVADLVRQALGGETVAPVEFTRRRPGGDIIVSLSLSPLRVGGRLVGVSAIGRDVSPLKRARDLLAREQKLDSLEMLAGGIAHNFNNLFAVALGNCERVLTALPPEHLAHARVRQVVDALLRASAISREMVSLSGRGALRPGPTDLSALVEGALPALRRGLPDTVVLEAALASDLPAAQGDVDQIQKALANLVANAREALEESPGMVTVRTALRTVTAEDARDIDSTGAALVPGPHVCLEVRDDGPGMDVSTLERAFDPFFSTRFVGRGLGLATVLGIVRGHRGGVRIDSEVGRGTRVTILLPCAPSAQEVSP